MILECTGQPLRIVQSIVCVVIVRLLDVAISGQIHFGLTRGRNARSPDEIDPRGSSPNDSAARFTRAILWYTVRRRPLTSFCVHDAMSTLVFIDDQEMHSGERTATGDAGMNRCADCKHVTDQRDHGDEEPNLRCGLMVPFWVPLPIHDYRSWVMPDDGKNCNAFEQRNLLSFSHTP